MIDVFKGKPALRLEGMMCLAGFTVGDIRHTFYHNSPRKQRGTKPYIVFCFRYVALIYEISSLGNQVSSTGGSSFWFLQWSVFWKRLTNALGRGGGGLLGHQDFWKASLPSVLTWQRPICENVFIWQKNNVEQFFGKLGCFWRVTNVPTFCF